MAIREILARLDRRRGGRAPKPGASIPLPEWALSGTDEEFVEAAYQNVLQRAGDPGGVAFHLEKLSSGEWSRQDVVNAMAGSAEAEAGPMPVLALESFHRSRVEWVQSLPAARRILDLGGTSLGDDRGALVVMGYPHEFDDLVIIELPSDERHQLYRLPEASSVKTDLGPVRYLYRSMTDLDDLPDRSFDLICSAQTFEHIYPDEGAKLLVDVARLLAPGGVLALDTPNGAVSSIEAREKGTDFINPDHKIEYTHQQMLDLFAAAGLTVTRQVGIGWMPQTADKGTFKVEELVDNPGLFEDIERCYTLAYLAAAR